MQLDQMREPDFNVRLVALLIVNPISCHDSKQKNIMKLRVVGLFSVEKQSTNNTYPLTKKRRFRFSLNGKHIAL